MTAQIELMNVSKSYGPVRALSDVHLKLSPLGHYAIRGASGSGKSTLLHLMAGLDIPSQGEIIVEGQKLHLWDDEKLANYRNRYVGLIFQHHFLLPTMNCMQNVLLPAEIGGVPIKKVKEEVYFLSKVLGVEKCLEKFPYQISGGEQQRINILRAISLHPKLLLCDEPTGNLDSQNTQNVVKLLTDLAKEFNATLVVVTHDENVASHFSQQVVIRDGRIQ